MNDLEKPEFIIVHSPNAAEKNERYGIFISCAGDYFPLLWSSTKKDALKQLDKLLIEMRSNITERRNG